MKEFTRQLLRWVVPACVVTNVALGGPTPTGMSTITVSYETNAGMVSFGSDRNYTGRLGDQTPLGNAPNISAFNSSGREIGVFGRRTAPILLANPKLPPVFRPNETLVSHAFFKIDNSGEFFPGLIEGGDLTVSIDNIQFSEPATIVEDTLMLHAKWRPEQSDLLDEIYIHIDDHYTITDSFRDFDTFLNHIFFDQPVSNYVLNEPDLAWTITGNGTDTLGLSLTFPYDLLRNLEETGQEVLPGLPAPQGFLEPFHFHIEYVVAPEPGSLALLLVGTLLAWRRRRSTGHTR